MKTATYEKFNYALRPAKSVERKMLCDLFCRLVRLENLRMYRYVGMGSLSFVDFALYHRRLGFGEMISIERQERDRERFEFNKPYANISMLWGDTGDQLPLIDWRSKRSVVWLDYDKPILSSMLDDVARVVANAVSGSILVISLPADPGDEPKRDDALLQKRLDDFKAKVGKIHFPRDLKPSQMRRNRYGDACKRVFDSVITTALKNANAPLSLDERIEYRQLLNFRYADGTPMCTFGGVLWNESDKTACGEDFLDGLEFVRQGEESCRIETPVLTLRETAYLDRVLTEIDDPGELDWLPLVEQQRYKRVARYAPTYIDVEI